MSNHTSTARDALLNEHSFSYKVVRHLYDAFLQASMIWDEAEQADLIDTLRNPTKTWAMRGYGSEYDAWYVEWWKGQAALLEVVFKAMEEA